MTSLFRLFKIHLEGWEQIDNPPRWVHKAYERWDRKLLVRPYLTTKHFVGKSYIYRVRHKPGNQGECLIIGWYRKLKHPYK